MFDEKLMSIPGAKKLIVKLFCLSFAQGITIVFEALFLAIGITKAWQHKNVTALFLPMLLFFIFFSLRYLMTRIESSLTDKFASITCGSLKEQLLAKIFDLGPTIVSKVGSGHLITLALEGIDKIENYFNLIIIKTVNLTILPVIILIAVFFLDKLSALILLLMFPIIILFMIILGKAAVAKSDSQYQGFTNMSNNFIDSMRGLKTLKLFGLSKHYSKNIFKVSENYRKRTMNVLKVALLSTFALDFYTTISIAVVALFLGINLINGKIALFTALAILVLCPDYFLPIREYGDDYHATLDGKNALLNLNEILAIKSPKAKIKLKDFKRWNNQSSLTLNNLNFNYEQNEGTLKNISCSLTGCKKIGIVGKSGSGKSTLLNIIGGWLQPTNAWDNPFIINDQQIDSLAQNEWQKHISYIPQDPYIFSGTIAENISFYQPSATLEDIKNAAKKAGLTTFIASLKDGLKTKIGEAGRGISGGQAQRIALARALLDSNRNILLLDEPTAHLDIETEYELKQTMLPLFENHLVLFATHRLHWMQDMDYVLVMENGEIVEQGIPNELLQKPGVYNDLITEIRGAENEKHF